MFTRYDVAEWTDRFWSGVIYYTRLGVEMIMLNPVETFLIVAISLIIFVVVTATASMWRLSNIPRGSRMNRKERAKWARRHMANRFVDVLEEDYGKGTLTDAEVSWGHRLVATAFKTRGFIVPELYGVKAVSKAKKPEASHFKEVKEGLMKRLSWKFRRILFAPVRIPGPPIPKDQEELLSQPKKKQGRFFKYLTRNA